MKKINDYLFSWGILEINANTPIYNGNSIRTIISRFPKKMPKEFRKEYLKNCIEVYIREYIKIDLKNANVFRYRNYCITKSFLNY